MTRRYWCALLFVLFTLEAFPQAIELKNAGLTIQIDPASGSLVSLRNELTGESYRTKALAFNLQTDRGEVIPARASVSRRLPDGVEFAYETAQVRATVRYRAPSGQDFLEKHVEITNVGASPLLLHKVVLERVEFSPAFAQGHPHYDPSQFRWLINLFLRGTRGGFYFGIENPVYEYWTKGATPGVTWVQLDYHPRVQLQPGESYTSESSFVGACRKEGVYLFKELGKLRDALEASKPMPSALNLQQEVLDWGEV